MKVTANITIDVDPQAWAKAVEGTEGQNATEVREDIRADMEQTVLEAYREAGLLKAKS